MRRIVWLSLLTLLSALPAAAQDQEPTTTLSVVFQNLYGPNGLVVNSEPCCPTDPRTRRISIALSNRISHSSTSRSPASSRRCRCRRPPRASRIASMRRLARSCGRRRASARSSRDRAETIGRGRFAFNYNFQYFSFDRLEGHRPEPRPVGLHARRFPARRRPRRRRHDAKRHRRVGRPVDRGADLRADGSSGLSLARAVVHTRAERDLGGDDRAGGDGRGARHAFLPRS